MPTALALVIAMRQLGNAPAAVQLRQVREFERAIHNAALDLAIMAVKAVESGRVAAPDGTVAEIEFFRIAPIGENPRPAAGGN